MNKHIKGFWIIVIIGMLISIGSCTQSRAKLPTWLEGTWATGDTLGLSAEAWEVINTEFMTGEGLFILRDGSSVIELLNIFIRDGVLFYTAIIPNQNNGEEIVFIDKNNDSDSLVFENPMHDYPKKIIYNKIDKDMIEVFIFGDAEDDYTPITLTRVPE